MKSERLKKLEAELKDLEQWLKLGLVPKKDIPKHEAEIESIRSKLGEEKERLLFLKENDVDEYIAPKRSQGKAAYQSEVPSVPDIDFGDGATNAYGGGDDEEEGSDEETEVETEAETEAETASEENEEVETEVEDEAESFFSERRRWRGEGIIDPEADDW